MHSGATREKRTKQPTEVDRNDSGGTSNKETATERQQARTFHSYIIITIKSPDTEFNCFTWIRTIFEGFFIY